MRDEEAMRNIANFYTLLLIIVAVILAIASLKILEGPWPYKLMTLLVVWGMFFLTLGPIAVLFNIRDTLDKILAKMENPSPKK